MSCQKYVILLLFLVSVNRQSIFAESFVVSPTAAAKKKKKSISILREELIEAFEEFAHNIVHEIEIMSDSASLWLSEKPSDQLIELLKQRRIQLEDAKHFLQTGAFVSGKYELYQNKGIELALLLIRALAQVQEQLLVVCRQLLEHDESNHFMQSQKSELTQQIVLVKQLVCDSEQFVSKMRIY